VRRLFERHPHFALQLRKRAGDAYADRISVGRARNKDVVLREESVSKFHAWFEMDEEGRFYLADAGSANGTRVAGRLLVPRELSPVAMGAVIEFGGVRATLCPGELLWRAFHQAG
jgi:pSer/pThr/pTyr-binding forkhead associated (FHA) protein